MSTATVAKPQAKQSRKGGRRMSLPVLLLVIAGVLVLTSAVRLITGADGITSTGQMSTALRLAPTRRRSAWPRMYAQITAAIPAARKERPRVVSPASAVRTPPDSSRSASAGAPITDPAGAAGDRTAHPGPDRRSPPAAGGPRAPGRAAGSPGRPAPRCAG